MFKTDNATATQQTYPVGITLDYTKTSSWEFNLSEAVTLGLKSTFDVGVPGIGEVETEISLYETTTISKGKGASESESKQYGAGATVTVPAFTTYQTVITGTTETYDVPFTYTGLVTYRTGATANVSAKGTFSGGDTGVFDIQTTCVSAPNGCPAPPEGGVAIPEPDVLALLPALLLASVAVRHLRTRPGRQTRS